MRNLERWEIALGVGAVGVGGYFLYRAVKGGASGGDAATPPEFICPITMSMMKRPVFTSDGHSYERLAIIRWLQEHNTSPKTGAELPDRDIRPNHGLRAQIADFLANQGMEPLPGWKPDAVETIQSIMPQDNPLGGAAGQQPGIAGMMLPPPGMMQGGGGGTIQVPVQGPNGMPQMVNMQIPPGMLPQGMAQVPGMPGAPQPPPMTDSFGCPPDGQPTITRALAKLMVVSPQIAANVEAALALPGGTHARDAAAVARILLSHPQVFTRVMNQVMGSTELQRTFSLAMYYSPDTSSFTVPGQWGTAILAVRNSDIMAVEQHVSRPSFLPQSAEAATMLIEAVWCRESQRMTTLLVAKGVPVNVTDSLGCNVLAGASFRGDVEIVQLLLDKQANPNQAARGGSTALHQAAFKGHLAVVELLLAKGANALATKEDGSSPLLLACLMQHHDTAMRLIAHIGPSALEIADIFGLIPLSAAARGGSLQTVTEIVKMTPAATRERSLNLSTQDGGYATHHAAWCGHTEIVDFLLGKGVSSGVTNSNGDTVMHIASTRGDLGMIKMLLERDANLEHASPGPDLCQSKNREAFTPLHCACWRKHANVARALVEGGSDVEAVTSNRSTALHLAAWHGDVEICELLLDAGALIGSRTRDGDTALHQAAFNNHSRCVLFLLDKHAGLEIPPAVATSRETEKVIDAQKVDGNTALHLASIGNHVDMVDTLLSKGCNATLTNRNGLTALVLARNHQRNDAVLRLESHNAR
jgi:ankyrin repeat protein